MKLKITSIKETGDASKECVSIEVLEDCNLDYFGVAHTTYNRCKTTNPDLIYVGQSLRIPIA